MRIHPHLKLAGASYRLMKPTAERTLESVEATHMIRKGQVKSLDVKDAVGQAKFVMSLFQVAA